MNKTRYAEKLTYLGTTYKYSHSKGNVLIYVSQPAYYYEDWVENGGILVVQYRPNTKNNQYYVLHQLSVCEGTGHITHLNITKQDRIAKPYIKD